MHDDALFFANEEGVIFPKNHEVAIETPVELSDADLAFVHGGEPLGDLGGLLGGLLGPDGLVGGLLKGLLGPDGLVGGLGG